jgi:transposase
LRATTHQPYPNNRAPLHRDRATHHRATRARPGSRGEHLESELELILRTLTPAQLAEPGVGVITAAQIINAWSHTGRFRSEAAFASLGGAAPIPASSGQTVRYRLNRGGDRQLNRALHTITLSRLTHHPQTRAYAARRAAEGKTPREIKRCLKRYLARHLYRLLEQTPTAA